ncbi:MAG: exodeoxyribonuclease III [Anaerolinea sp.]|nr:exodeoxyribonuclease III [Anaerolinea sp.]
MKITTWNINGFRAVLKKDFVNSIKSLSPDILCLQELKAKKEQLGEEDINIPGYDHLWNSAVRPGYSGVGTYVKQGLSISAHNTGLGVEEFDIEGRVIQTNINNLVLFNIYFPNGQRGQDRVDYKLRFYARLLELCKEEHEKGKNIIITGDFNTAHNEIDLANPKENSKISGFLPEERVWIDKYLENGFTDAYRKLYPNKVQYTWWTYRVNARARGIGWRLDYFLVSNPFMQYVKDVTICDQVLGSDHCPVTLEIND